MKVLAVSQRCDYIKASAEDRDCLDVTFAPMLWKLGYKPLILPSRLDDFQAYLSSFKINGFILSGGNNIGESPERDLAEKTILDYSLLKNLPVMGICRGMQFMNYYQGGNTRKHSGHTSNTHIINGELSNRLDIMVNSYHDFSIFSDDLGEGFIPTALSPDGVIEAFAHKTYPWCGIMWHPERNIKLSNFDSMLIKNHFG